MLEARGNQHVLLRDTETVGHRLDQGNVAGLGEKKAAVGMTDVVGEMLVTAGVVDADDGRTGQCCTPEREQVVGCVVEQHGDV